MRKFIGKFKEEIIQFSVISSKNNRNSASQKFGQKIFKNHKSKRAQFSFFLSWNIVEKVRNQVFGHNSNSLDQDLWPFMTLLMKKKRKFIKILKPTLVYNL